MSPTCLGVERVVVKGTLRWNADLAYLFVHLTPYPTIQYVTIYSSFYATSLFTFDSTP